MIRLGLDNSNEKMGGVSWLEEHIYLCIDLKLFYASVEYVERRLHPLTTNLAVADPERSEKTTCLAISRP